MTGKRTGVHWKEFYTEGEYTPLIIQIFWHLARMEREELRRVSETAEKQKLKHVLSTLIGMGWSWNQVLVRALTTVHWMEKEILAWLLLSLQGWFMCWCGKRFQGLEHQFDTSTSPRPASLCADREGFRETPPLKAHFLPCSCAQHGLCLWNSGLDSLTEGLHSSPGSDLCVTPRCGPIKLWGVALAEV